MKILDIFNQSQRRSEQKQLPFASAVGEWVEGIDGEQIRIFTQEHLEEYNQRVEQMLRTGNETSTAIQSTIVNRILKIFGR